MNKAMNGVLYTIDGEVLCEFPEFKIGNKQYKDKTVIKIHCTNCCVVRKVQKWKFDCAEQMRAYHKMVLLQSMRKTDRI